MSTSSFASYVIAKLSGNITLDKAIVSDMSGRPKRLSSKPKLTAVWRTKSIPYEGSDQSQSTFKEDGSLLRLLRTKSMPSLRRGGDPATRILKASSSSPPAPHSGLENNLSISPSNSSLPPVTTKSLNPRSSQDMSECSDSTSAYVTMTITNQSDHSQEDHNKLTRSASDGHLWAVRKKKLRDVRNEFPAGTLPSVKSLRNKFDGKSETDSQSADETASWGSPVAAQHITSDSDVMDSPAAKLSPSKPFINKETPIKPGSLGKSAETPTDKSSSKMLETPPKSIKKRLQQFEKSPQSLPDDLPNTTLSSETHTASGDTVWQDTSGTSPCPASKPIMIVEKRPERESRQKRKNDGKGFRPRAKSEPDPSSIRRLNSETIPVSVRKLKMQFEQQATIEAASIKAPTSPHRAYQKRKEKLTAGHTKVQTEVTGVSDQDNIDKRSEKPSTPPRELKPPRVEGRDTSPAPLTPEVIVDSQATPSVRKLRKQFEKASSTQSHTKSAGRDVPSKPRMTIKMELRSPFEDAFDPQETEDQKKERLNHTLTQEIHYGTSVRNILRQFETLSPEEHKTQVDRKFTFENKPPDEAKPAGEILSLSLGESSTRDSEAKLDISQDSEMDFDVDSCSSSSDVDKATLLPGIQESKTAWSSDDDDEDMTKTVIPKDIDTGETKKKIAEYWALRELEIEGNQREEQTKMEDKYVEDEKEREKDRMENEEEEQKRRELHQAEIERKERENSEREQMKEKAEQERKEKERVEKELKKENTEKVRKDKEKAQQKEKEREEQERKKREEAEKAIKEKEKTILALIKKEKAELDRQEREKMENERKEKEKVEQEEKEKVEKECLETEIRDEQQREKEREEQERKESEKIGREISERQNEEVERGRQEEEQIADHDVKTEGYEEASQRHIRIPETQEGPGEGTEERKVEMLIDKFANIQENESGNDRPRSNSAHSDDLGSDKENTDHKVGQLIDKFTSGREFDFEEGHRDDGHNILLDDGYNRRYSDVNALVDKFANINKKQEVEEGHREEVHYLSLAQGNDRRHSDVTALVDKFANINKNPERSHGCLSSDSEEAGSDSSSSVAKTKKDAPIPTIAVTVMPGKVRTLKTDELQFFEMGNTVDPFIRSQSLRAKKADPPPFTKPRSGSLREKKTRVAALAESEDPTKSSKSLPQNCRKLHADELCFFNSGNNNIYSIKGESKSKGKKNTSDKQQDFRLASQGDPSDSSGFPGDDQHFQYYTDSDSEGSILRGNDSDEMDDTEDILLGDELRELHNSLRHQEEDDASSSDIEERDIHEMLEAPIVDVRMVNPTEPVKCEDKCHQKMPEKENDSATTVRENAESIDVLVGEETIVDWVTVAAGALEHINLHGKSKEHRTEVSIKEEDKEVESVRRESPESIDNDSDPTETLEGSNTYVVTKENGTNIDFLCETKANLMKTADTGENGLTDQNSENENHKADEVIEATGSQEDVTIIEVSGRTEEIKPEIMAQHESNQSMKSGEIYDDRHIEEALSSLSDGYIENKPEVPTSTAAIQSDDKQNDSNSNEKFTGEIKSESQEPKRMEVGIEDKNTNREKEEDRQSSDDVEVTEAQLVQVDDEVKNAAIQQTMNNSTVNTTTETPNEKQKQVPLEKETSEMEEGNDETNSDADLGLLEETLVEIEYDIQQQDRPLLLDLPPYHPSPAKLPEAPETTAQSDKTNVRNVKLAPFANLEDLLTLGGGEGVRDNRRGSMEKTRYPELRDSTSYHKERWELGERGHNWELGERGDNWELEESGDNWGTGEELDKTQELQEFSDFLSDTEFAKFCILASGLSVIVYFIFVIFG